MKPRKAGTIVKAPALPASLLQAKKGLASTARFVNTTFRRLLPHRNNKAAPPAPEKEQKPSLKEDAASTTPTTASAPGPAPGRDQAPHDEMESLPTAPVPTAVTAAAPVSPPSPTSSVQQEVAQNQKQDLDALEPLAEEQGKQTQLTEQLRRQAIEESLLQVEVPFCMPSSAASDPDRHIHQKFMEMALEMARLALKTNETPVGCVLVRKGEVIARGMNATNVTRNGTKHAEYMAIAALLSRAPQGAPKELNYKRTLGASAISQKENVTTDPEPTNEEEEFARQGHLYPYGQKLHRDWYVDRSIIHECVLYVTVEPCVMCAALLRQLGIKKVYFGAVNDKFGGTGGVFRIHLNSSPTPEAAAQALVQAQQAASVIPAVTLREATNQPIRGPRPGGFAVPRTDVVIGPRGAAYMDGDGGSVEKGFDVEGGWGRDEAVSLLRRFYVQENGRAPVPRKKDGRAARLATMEGALDSTADGSDLSLPSELASSSLDGLPSLSTSAEVVTSKIGSISLEKQPETTILLQQ